MLFQKLYDKDRCPENQYAFITLNLEKEEAIDYCVAYDSEKLKNSNKKEALKETMKELAKEIHSLVKDSEESKKINEVKIADVLYNLYNQFEVSNMTP